MRKLKYVVLLFCLSFIVIGCMKKEKPAVSTSTPLLLEVSKDGMDNKLYLFGSIHAGEETLYPLPDYIMNAYQKSDIIAVEFDLVKYSQNILSQVILSSKFEIPNGEKITKYIDEETYDRGVKILKDVGIYSPMLDYYNPVMWQSLMEGAVIEDINLSETYGVDNYILNLAQEDEKEILELESAEYQYNLLLSFSDDMQVYLLKQSIDGYQLSKNSTKALYEFYKKGDQEEIEKLLFQEETGEYEKEYNDKLIVLRNNNMVISLEETFQNKKNVLCVVGLAHIIGENGIANQLEQKGYTVRIIQS